MNVPKVLTGLRLRLAVLMGVLVLPAFALLAISANEQMAYSMAAAKDNVLHIARLAAAEQRARNEAVEAMMRWIAQFPEVQGDDGPSCSKRLDSLLKETTGFIGFSVARADGSLWCVGPMRSLTQTVNNAQLPYFVNATQAKQFAMGGYQVGRVSGRGNFTFGYPVYNVNGQLQNVIGAGLSIDLLNSQANASLWPSNTVLLMLDHTGTVLVRVPDSPLVGQQFLDTPIIKAILQTGAGGAQEGVQEAEGLDGVKRLYAFTATRMAGKPAFYTAVGMPLDGVYGPINQQFRRNVFALGVFGLIALACTWVVGNLYIARPMRMLTRAARALQQGQWLAPAQWAQLQADKSEIGELGTAFSSMADSLRHRETELKAGAAQSTFLASANQTLAALLSHEVTVQCVAQLAVPALADWCTVNLLEPNGEVRLRACVHVDPNQAEFIRAWANAHPVQYDNDTPLARAMRRGQPELHTYVYPESLMRSNPQQTDDGLRHWCESKTISVMAVPMMARGQIFGALHLARIERGSNHESAAQSDSHPKNRLTENHYTPQDLALAEAFAQRAAFALDNARLYEEAQQHNAQLEQRVVARTLQLQRANADLLASREDLRAMSGRMMRVVEDERTRIAREVHDELGQALTGLKMTIAPVVRRLKDENADRHAAAAKLTDTLSEIDQTIRSVRRIATELRPGILDQLGLQAALEWQLQEFETRTGIYCFLQVSNLASQPPVFSNEVATAAFRIVQESLTNVMRHAQASQVDVLFKTDTARLLVKVSDNGVGMAQPSPGRTGSFGLLGIQERARQVEGLCKIVGTPGQGTTVVVVLPLQK